MLNSADNNSFSGLVSVYLKVFDHLTLNSDFLKLRIWKFGTFTDVSTQCRSNDVCFLN